MKFLVAILLLATPLALPAAPCAGFADVEDGSPFCSSVAWIRNRGITVGCSATLYCSDSVVTRLQMAAFLSRMAPAGVPVLYDANESLVGHLLLVPIHDAATDDNLVYPVAMVTASGAVHQVQLDTANSGFSLRTTDVWYEQGNCDEAGRKWVAVSLRTPLTSKRAVPVNFSPQGLRLAAMGASVTAPALESLTSLSYRSSLNGVCTAWGHPLPPGMQVYEVADYLKAGLSGSLHVR